MNMLIQHFSWCRACHSYYDMQSVLGAFAVGSIDVGVYGSDCSCCLLYCQLNRTLQYPMSTIMWCLSAFNSLLDYYHRLVALCYLPSWKMFGATKLL